MDVNSDVCVIMLATKLQTQLRDKQKSINQHDIIFNVVIISEETEKGTVFVGKVLSLEINAYG